jgi:hypothetical protein
MNRANRREKNFAVLERGAGVHRVEA